jgi:cystathionine beta-lyase/cystathionine gamma-synthase
MYRFPKKSGKSRLDDGLIRLSVGIEDSEDLIFDLESALKSQG